MRATRSNARCSIADGKSGAATLYGVRMAKIPRYTDNRYPNGYVRAASTDIGKTFRRVRAELKAKAEQEAKDDAERQEKVRRMAR